MQISHKDVTEIYNNVAHMDSGRFKLFISDIVFTQRHINDLFNLDGVDFVWGIGVTYSKYKLLVRINSNEKFDDKEIILNIINTLRPNEQEQRAIDNLMVDTIDDDLSSMERLCKIIDKKVN